MKNILYSVVLALMFSGCVSFSSHPYYDIDIEAKTPEGAEVLEVGKEMVNDGEILSGSCWDYINKVYNRAGFPYKKRRYVFKNSARGPYASKRLIEPGDWLYYINHSYHKVVHSGIFVRWQNYSRSQALILSYPGESRSRPGNFKTYNISNVYTIIRPKR